MPEDYLSRRAKVRGRVALLKPRARAAFAAACAERARLLYTDYCSRERVSPAIWTAFEQSWIVFIERREEPSPVDTNEVAAKIPDDRDVDAQDAAIALVYAIRVMVDLREPADSAFFAGDTVLNVLVANVHNILEIDDYGPRYDSEVLPHHLVIGEFERQERDLTLLEESSDSSDESLKFIRVRASTEPIELLPVHKRSEPLINPFTGKQLPRA